MYRINIQAEMDIGERKVQAEDGSKLMSMR